MVNLTEVRPLVWLLGSLCIIAGCETSGGQQDTANPSDGDDATILSDALGSDASKLTTATEHLRDRSFKSLPGWSAREGALDPPSHCRGDTYEQETRLLGRILFGLDDTAPVAPVSAFRKLAYFDRDSSNIVFRRDAPSAQKLEVAVVMALVEALDAQHFDAVPRAATLDGCLGRTAARDADKLLVAGAHLARDGRTPRTVLRQLAQQPGRALAIAPLGDYLRRAEKGPEAPVESHDELADRLTTFLLRESLSLGAAFHRANGWSGVELLHSFHPESTADIVRPDRWMQGRALGDWTWPDDSPLAEPDAARRTGRAGPAIIAAWLSQKFRPDLARTVYSGWRSDTFRYGTTDSEGGDTEAWRFEWMSQWDSPSSARQIAAGFEKLLGEHYDASGNDAATYTVVRAGLKVGVLVQSAARPADADWPTDATYLTAAKVQYSPREPLPTRFQPTRTERFRRTATDASLDENIWQDPASKLEVNLSAVSDWEIRLSRTLPLRWFAKKNDYLLQMTTELANPFGPAFGSDAYMAHLEEAFTASIENATFTPGDMSETQLSERIQFRVEGQKADQSWRLEAWQVRHGDVIATISLQGPADQFDSNLQPARDVVDSLQASGEPPESTSAEDDEGTIEYEIEDSDTD
jgi:hypothetical protein